MSLDGISAGQEALGRLLLGCGPVSGGFWGSRADGTPTRTHVRVPAFGAVVGRVLALRESRNVTLGTARCDLPPLSFSAAGRHLGVAPCPALDFPRANRRSRSVRL
jgi:hypothetical protein